ncbi:phenylalanine--tRNA ligase subunit beta [Patescibacteria group bacterium]|nr:phenylalanine--tRNA ligase subunit beta [Patescibacteria group bacterium]
MLFSYNWLSEYIQGELPVPKKLGDLLSMHAFEVENVEKKNDDWILDIDVLPDRAHDALNHMGIAREIAAITGKEFIPCKTIEIEAGNEKALDVNIRSKNLVPRYHALVIKGVKIGKSPKWLKERLEAVGVNSVNNIVDITNYVMLETGQPSHAFDYNKIQGSTMTIRTAKDKEKIVTLDDEKFDLPNGTLIIEDAKRIIDLAGIKGGKVSGITEKTKNIVLQAATFDAKTIYRTKKKLNYTTQAADIYSQGIDENLSDVGLSRAVYLVQKLAGGTVTQKIDLYPEKVVPKTIRLDLNYAEKLLGMNIEEKTAKQILESLGCIVKGDKVKIPTRRLDLNIQEDLIEEIGRIIGYEKIKPVFPLMPIQPAQVNKEIIWQNRIKDALKEIGFTEVYNYSFAKSGQIELENPISQEYQYLRDNIIKSLLKNVAKNQKSIGHMRIFEIGNIFYLPAGRQGNPPQERQMLAGIITGEHAFYEVKGIVDFLLNRLGIPEVHYDETKADALWHAKRVAIVHNLGLLGEISKGNTVRLKISKRIGAFYLDLEKLLQLVSDEKGYRPASRFPASIRDIALLVPRDVRVVDVLNKINQVGGMLIDDVDLFDMYEGEGIPDGKKNLAFHIVYQSQERTLTNKEVDKVHEKIIKRLEQNPSWQLRK